MATAAAISQTSLTAEDGGRGKGERKRTCP